MKIAAYARASLGALALSLLVGCGGTQSFTVSQEFEIDGLGTQTDSVDINLADYAGDAWDHRDKVKDAKITYATAVIRQVHGDNTATSVAGTASVSRGDAESVFASGTETVAVDSAHEAQNLGATAKILKDALKGNGELSIAYEAIAIPDGARTHITIEVLIDVEVEWSLF